MPKTRIDKYAEAPIDWLWAAILYRIAVTKTKREALAKTANISYDYMRVLLTRSPWEWPDDVREAVCKYLKIRPVRGVYGQPEE